MSSVHRQPNRPCWFCAYYNGEGKRVFKSTGTANKKAAVKICNAWEKAAKLARLSQLSPDRARAILEDGLREILEGTGVAAPKQSIEQYFTSWIKVRESVTKASTFVRYDGIVKQFLTFLGTDRKLSITGLSTETIERYREELSDRVSPSSVNTHLKVIRVALKKAVPRYFSVNPASHVENLDNSQRQHRRAFTLEELRKLIDVASEEWKTMILVGTYTGLRMGDCASLRWNHIDLARGEITITTTKTGRTQILPIAKALRRHIETLPAGDDPKAPLCPGLHGKPSASLSNQFFEIMATAGLVTSRAIHTKKEDGRDKRRKLNEIGFHALRHTATSLLKNAGVSDVVARDLIGHESELISKNYTHIETATKRAAVDKMPDVMAEKKEAKG